MKKVVKPTNKFGKGKYSKKENELQDQIDQLTDGIRRSQADFVNFKRRMEEEKDTFAKYSNLSLLESIIPVYDQLKMSLDHIPEEKGKNKNKWIEGVQNIVKLFEKELKGAGVKRIDTVGEKYHPEYHEAVLRGEGTEKDIILEEFEAGYLFHERVIRPAKVKVCTDVIKAKKEKSS